MVSVSGYLIGNQEAGRIPLRPDAEFNGGINTILPERGRAGYDKYRRIFRSSSGRSLRQNGTLMRRPSIARQPPLEIRIMGHRD